MSDRREKDAMVCRFCGNEERASEGYPCTECGTFICVICSFRGVMKCRSCADAVGDAVPASPEIPLIDWPEH
ncbi:MAG TPA: hypothetical protein VHM24_12290 [Gemmatimonadaceae bacterium]|nr:hypothetical protein [Gemmatimonadaceae bacterium]